MGFWNFFSRISDIVAGRDKSGNYYYFLNEDSFGNEIKYLEWSLTNPVLQTVIALRCKLYSQMQITAQNSKGENIDIPELKLLSKPNYFQSQQDFFFQQMWFLSATGNNYMYQIKPFESQAAKSLVNLVPDGIDLKKIQKIKKFISSASDISNFEKQTIKYTLDDASFELPLSSIIPLYDLANGIKCNSIISSPSRIRGIKGVLFNIDENIKSKNINLKMSQKYLGKNNSNPEGQPQIQDKDREDIIRKIGSRNLSVTNANVEIQHLVKDLKNLSLDPMFESDAIKVLLAFDMNRDVLNYSSTGSKFDNNEQGIVNVIQNSIQSSADNTMNSLTNSWGLDLRGIKLVASYDHLPVMQALVKTKIETFDKLQDSLKKAIENGTMSDAEAKEMSNKIKTQLGL